MQVDSLGSLRTGFGFLNWNPDGADTATSLSQSLTGLGNSLPTGGNTAYYRNLFHLADTQINWGDWVTASLVGFSTAIQNALMTQMSANRVMRVVLFHYDGAVPAGDMGQVPTCSAPNGTSCQNPGQNVNPATSSAYPNRWMFQVEEFIFVRIVNVTSSMVTFEYEGEDPSCAPPPIPTPPDLVVSSVTGPTANVSPTPYQPTYTVTVTNQGDTDISYSPFNVTLWASDHVITDASPLMPSSFATEAGVTKFGTATVVAVTPLTANGGSATVTITGSFPAALPGGAPYYLYAAADSYDTAPPAGSSLGAIDEADVSSPTPDWAQEQNNVGAPLSVTVVASADLATRIGVDHPTHLTGDRAVYVVSVQNNGPAATTASPSVQLTTDLPSLVTGGMLALRDGLSDPPVASSGTFDETSGVWQVGPLASGATATLTLPVTILATGANTPVALHITAYTLLDAGVTDPNVTNNPMACTAPAGTDDCKTGTITVVDPASLTPASNPFGDVAIGHSSAPVTFTLTNAGSADLHVGTFGQTGSTEFVVSSNTCANSPTIAAGHTCTFVVTFSPSAVGDVTGGVSITDDAAGSPQTATFSGSGASAIAPPVLVSPRSGAVIYTPKVTLTWRGVRGAQGYHVRIGLGSGFDQPQTADPTRASAPFTLTAFGTYFWEAAARDALGLSVYQTPFHFEYTLNRSPRNGVTLKTGLARFIWQAVKGKSYQLQVYTDDTSESTRNSSALYTLPLTRASYLTPRASPLASGPYYWRVSIDGGASWTNGWRFTVK